MELPPLFIGTYADRYLLARDVCDDYAMTLRARMRAFENFAGPTEVSSLGYELVNAWLASIQATGCAAWTAKGYRAAILAVWNAAADERLCEHPNPRLVRKIKIQQVIVEGWTKDEAQQIIRYITTMPGKLSNGVPVASYWNCAVRVGWDSGARRGDVMRLTRDQINNDGLWVYVTGKGGKLKADRLRGSTLAAIGGMFPPERGLVFEWPHCHEYWSTCFRKIVKAAGLRGTYKWLRRTS